MSQGMFVPDDVQDEMVRMYVEDGLSLREIGRRTYWTKTTVTRVLASRRVTLRPKGGFAGQGQLSQDELDRVVELYHGGLTATEIGRQIGRSRSAVCERLRSAGVNPRSRAHRNRIRRAQSLASGELTERQRPILRLVEAAGDAGTTTPEIAERLGANRHAITLALYQLESYGLVKCRRHKRPYRWTRSNVALHEVVERTLWPALAAGKPRAEDALPIGPLRDWLERWIAEEERKVRFMAVTGVDEGADGSGGLVSVGAVARALGIKERRLWALRHEQEVVSFALADRLLTNASRGERLEDLWPHLAIDDEPVAA